MQGKKKRKATPRRSRTRTSPFGTGRREGHDASPFYSLKLYSELPMQVPLDEQAESPLPAGIIDNIFVHSSEQMKELPANSVHLMVTSPPYNVGKDYDENMTLRQYTDFLNRVWKETFRVLLPGGRACVNVANLGRKPYLPLHAAVVEGMHEAGFLMRGEIIWDKGASAGSSCAWGSWMSPSNPTLRDVHEYILVFSKGAFKRGDAAGKEATISREEFLEYTRSVWRFPSVSARRVGHPAPFPVELPLRLIKLYTFSGDVVLDPFMGSGQTALAARQCGRRFVGYETNSEYVSLALKRLKE